MYGCDEILKNSFADFAFENYETAAYTSLKMLAESGGFTWAISAIEQNLSEKTAMAAWLEENPGAVTRKYAELSSTGTSAKI